MASPRKRDSLVNYPFGKEFAGQSKKKHYWCQLDSIVTNEFYFDCMAGACHNRSFFLLTELVYWEERPCFCCNLHTISSCFHHVMFNYFLRRDDLSWKVSSSCLLSFCLWNSPSNLCDLILCHHFDFSIIGGILMVGGLYCVLWGKSKESMTCEVSIEDGKPPVQEKESTWTKPLWCCVSNKWCKPLS